jgi:hypothetical protein
MAIGPRQQIADLRRAPGELSFEARIAGTTQRVWFRTQTPVTPPADAALAACLMPAMSVGGTLTLSDPVSPRILRTQREFQAIQRAWSLDWEFGDTPLEEVEVVAPTLVPEPPSPPGRVGLFFSGGVDSWSSLLDNDDVTDLIFVRGIDIVAGAPHQEGLADVVEERLREAAEAMGLTFHAVETNVRELSDPLSPWETYYGCAVVAVALFLSPLFERILIAGDSDYEMQVAFGANRLVDQLFSSERLEIVDNGGRYSRVQRVERIATHPIVQPGRARARCRRGRPDRLVGAAPPLGRRARRCPRRRPGGPRAGDRTSGSEGEAGTRAPRELPRSATARTPDPGDHGDR